jgi:hypothetical protein
MYLSLLQNDQTGSRVHLACHFMDMGCEADYLPPSSAKVMNEWSSTSTAPLCLHGMYGDSSTLAVYFV